MKKAILRKSVYGFGVMLLSITAIAQVGVNTVTPEVTLDVIKTPNIANTVPQGVSFPNIASAERDAFINTKEGTLIYNTDKKCIEMFVGNIGGVDTWKCLVLETEALPFQVTPAGFEGTYRGGIVFNSSNIAKFQILNNSLVQLSEDFDNSVTIQNGTANITTNGCTWVIIPSGGGSNSDCSNVSLNVGQSAVLSYQLQGTPEGGVLQADFSALGTAATQQKPIYMGNANIDNKIKYIASVDYGTESVQGIIDNGTNSLAIEIPYTSGSGAYNAVTVQQNTAPGENGDINTLTLEIPAGTFSANGTLTATVTVSGPDTSYEINKNIAGVEYDIATFIVNLDGNPFDVTLKGIGGIPDKKYGVATNGQEEHNFIYQEVTLSDGTTWLNNNLGAEYNNVDYAEFNPKQQRTSPTDYRAFGSLFQFGRDSDGHELFIWTSATNGSQKHNGATWQSNGALSYTPANDPCPTGFHTPTYAELIALQNTIGTGSEFWNDTTLRLPVVIVTEPNGNSLDSDPNRQKGHFRSSTADGSYGEYLSFDDTQSSTTDDNLYKSRGMAIRCKKD